MVIARGLVVCLVVQDGSNKSTTEDGGAMCSGLALAAASLSDPDGSDVWTYVPSSLDSYIRTECN